MNFLYVLLSILSAFPFSHATHTLESYQNLRAVSIKALYPRLANSTVPQCIELIQRLQKIHNLVLKNTLEQEDEVDGEEESEDGERLQGLLLTSAFDLLEVIERSNTTSCADIRNPLSPTTASHSLQGVKGELIT